MRPGPMRRGGRRSDELGPQARQRLAQANELLEAGQHAEAAAAFEEMAGIARQRGMTRMAAKLSARAAAAHAHSGNEQGLVQATDAAIADAKADGDKERSARTFGELVASVKESTYGAMSEKIDEAVKGALGVTPKAPAVAGATAGAAAASAGPVVNRAMRRNLPKQCPACGAPVSASRVDWNDDGTADCPFCSSTLSA